ncbi:MAG: hypothetical protein HWN67_19485 [Candidatus Helarchaeota archaeon]|nr:hypothetical protein [Candidatus Helarchaeota archaeon]
MKSHLINFVKKLGKKKLFFILIGIPGFIFYFYIISQFYLIASALYFLPFLIVAIATLRRKNFYLRATKLSIFLFLIFLITFPNVTDWGHQIYRRANRQSVIEWYHPFFLGLNTTFHNWFNDSYGIQFSEVKDEINKLQNISNFIYNPWWRRYTLDTKYFSLIRYTHDFDPPRLAFDHLPTISEIINNGFTADCTGIAVFSVSFLKFMGYDAYMAEGDSHDFPVVFINGTSILIMPDPIRFEPFRMYFFLAINPIYLNWWPGIGEPYLMFNDRFLIFPRPIESSLFDIYTEDYVFEDFFMPFLNGELMSPFLSWPIAIIALLGISFLINYYNNFPQRKKPSKKDLPNILFGWTILSIGAIILFIFCAFDLSSLGFLITSITFGLTFFTLDRDFANNLKIFNRFT